jgi:hypothetical protein
VDFGTSVVTGPWDFHVTANGVGNQIVWDNPVHSQYTLSFLLTDEQRTGFRQIIAAARFFNNHGQTARSICRWRSVPRQEVDRTRTARTRRQRTRISLRREYRFGPLDLRAAARVVHQVFNPMGGLD